MEAVKSSEIITLHHVQSSILNPSLPSPYNAWITLSIPPTHYVHQSLCSCVIFFCHPLPFLSKVPCTLTYLHPCPTTTYFCQKTTQEVLEGTLEVPFQSPFSLNHLCQCLGAPSDAFQLNPTQLLATPPHPLPTPPLS